MARCADGHGTIYHRADGRWEAQLRLADGRRKFLYSRSRRELARQLLEVRWTIASQLPVSAASHVLSEFLARWLKVTEQRVRPSTYENYRERRDGDAGRYASVLSL